MESTRCKVDKENNNNRDLRIRVINLTKIISTNHCSREIIEILIIQFNFTFIDETTILWIPTSDREEINIIL